jgi:hypothetical protein
MDTIYNIDGHDLTHLRELVIEAGSRGAALKVTIHTGEHGGLQVKVGGGCWTPPMGQLEPTCTTGRVRAAVERSRARAEPVAPGPSEQWAPSDPAVTGRTCGHAVIYWTATGCTYCEAEQAVARG